MLTSYTLADLPPGSVRITCVLCPRRGRYDRDRLVAKYGADMKCPDFLSIISADCNFRPPLSTVKVCGRQFEAPIDPKRDQYRGSSWGTGEHGRSLPTRRDRSTHGPRAAFRVIEWHALNRGSPNFRSNG
jgi:hypothetical protein